MRTLILVLAFCFVAGFAFADASFEIVSKDIDSNGNIRIWACHKVDGVEVESQYPKIDGKSVFCTRYSKQNFKDCVDKTAMENYIINDIKNYSNNLIQKEFDKKAPKSLNQIRTDYNSVSNTDFSTTNLDKLVGKKLTVIDVSNKLDTDNNGIEDKEIIIKTDGTKIEKAITL